MAEYLDDDDHARRRSRAPAPDGGPEARGAPTPAGAPSSSRNRSTRFAASLCPWTSSGTSSSSPRSSVARVVTVPATPSAAVGVTSGGTAALSSSRTWAPQASSSSAVGGSPCRNRSVRRTQPRSRLVWNETPSGPPRISSVEPPPTSTTSVDVGDRAARGDAAEGQERLLVAGEEARREAVAPLELTEERLAVLRVADGAGRERERSLGTELVCGLRGSRRERFGRERSPWAGACAASPRLLRAALSRAGGRAPRTEPSAHLGDEQPRRVRPDVDDGDPGHLRGTAWRSRLTASMLSLIAHLRTPSFSAERWSEASRASSSAARSEACSKRRSTRLGVPGEILERDQEALLCLTEEPVGAKREHDGDDRRDCDHAEKERERNPGPPRHEANRSVRPLVSW